MTIHNRNSTMVTVTVSTGASAVQLAHLSLLFSDGYGIGGSESLRFWVQNNNICTSKLVLIAQDLTSAFIERVFLLCGILSAACHSSMQKSVEMRVFHKLNQYFGRLASDWVSFVFIDLLVLLFASKLQLFCQ